MTIEARLAELEAKVRAQEDRWQILNLLNAYGPLVDSGDSHSAASLWTAGGRYSYSAASGGGATATAPDDLVDIYEGDWHQELIATGSAHLTATPVIAIEGDEAHAVAYSLVLRREERGWGVLRAAINRWHLRRTADGWLIVERRNRLLDGSEDSHELMGRVRDLGVPGSHAPTTGQTL